MTIIISVISLERKRGKTALIEQLTKRFTDDGFKVATIKHIHTSFNTVRKDTWRHLEAGAAITVATTPTEMIAIKRSVSPVLQEAIDFIHIEPDLILVEGYKHSNTPKILRVDNIADVKTAMNEFSNIVLVTGSILCNSRQITKLKVQHPQLRVCDFEELVRILKKQILEEIIDRLPGINCGSCGYKSCVELGEAIIKGKAYQENCTALTTKTTVLKIDGKVVPMAKFPQEVLRGIMLGFLTSLKGIKKCPADIEIKITP